jgi:hypothetical protein
MITATRDSVPAAEGEVLAVRSTASTSHTPRPYLTGEGPSMKMQVNGMITNERRARDSNPRGRIGYRPAVFKTPTQASVDVQ